MRYVPSQDFWIRISILGWEAECEAFVLCCIAIRQFIFRFARVNFEITPQVVYRLGTLVVVTAFILEVPKILFDINATQVCDNLSSCCNAETG